MHSPKLRLPVMKQQDEGSTHIIRWCLLVWAILRLIVSVLWTGTLMIGTIGTLRRLNAPNETAANYDHYKSHMWIFGYAILVQIVELGMLVTFVTAGIKKSVRLYRAYYRYCILTLVIYIIAVILCFILEYFGLSNEYLAIYLTYHIDEFPIIGDFFYFYFAFILIAIFETGLEILLIMSIKKLIKTYSFTPPENV